MLRAYSWSGILIIEVWVIPLVVLIVAGDGGVLANIYQMDRAVYPDSSFLL